jgi:hypothetical protein
MGMNKERLREHYEILPDEDIERLANYEADELSPEAQDVLRQEIKRRGLSDEFNVAADIQIRGLSEEEQRELIKTISMFSCPICGSKQNYLNAFNIMIAKSLIIVATVEKRFIIACPDCISANAKSALIKSLLLGWWAIPWGPIRTLQAVSANVRALDSEKHNSPTREFIEFVKNHSAAIKARIERIKDLNELLDVIDPD